MRPTVNSIDVIWGRKDSLAMRTLFLSLFLMGAGLIASPAAAQQIELSVDASTAGAKIDRNIFGQFAEHQGTHTSKVADRFQHHVMPFFSRNLCFQPGCR